MFEEYIFIVNLIAGLFLASAQSIYIVQIIKKQITPSLLTWMGWSILVTVALISQIVEYGWNWTLMGHLFSALGCTAIFIVSFVSKNFVILSKDWRYMYLGLGCIVLYLVFSDPWSTTIFAVLADGLLGMPTIIKAFHDPKTEKSVGWNIALGCWSLTLITCAGNHVIFILFPAYCFLFNAVMTYLTREKRINFIEQNRTSHR